MKSRIKKLTALLQDLNCDAFLASDPLDIAYLAGLWIEQSYLLVTKSGKVTCLTNFLYSQYAKKNKGLDVKISTYSLSIFDLITLTLKSHKCRNLAFDKKNLPLKEYFRINKLLLRENINLVGDNDVVAKLRMIKTTEEINFIKKSIDISGQAFKFANEIADPRMSEKDLSIEIDRFLRLKGDNQIAFETIVSTGKNTVFPHHRCSSKKLDKNFFLIDLGSKYYGYCADLTRVFFWGKMPPLFKRVYDVVKKAQDLSIKKIKDGAKACEVDKTARKYINSKGWGKYFGHGLGHGVGLAVHEPPVLGPGSKDILKEGMVITVEPAVYFKNRFGIRIEDMVLVRPKKGEILSGNIDK